jgi:hypothetical protein
MIMKLPSMNVVKSDTTVSLIPTSFNYSKQMIQKQDYTRLPGHQLLRQQ